MAKRKTHKEFIEEIYNLVKNEYTVLSQYKNTDTKVLMKHNSKICNNYEWEVTPHKFLSGTRCPNCQIILSAKRRKKTTEIFKKEVYDLVNDEYTVLTEYLGNHKNILLKHNNDECNNNEFKMTPSHFLGGQRCPKCGYKKVSKARSISNEEFLERLYNAEGTKYISLTKYINNSTKVKFKHNIPECGHEFKMTPNCFLDMGQRCPKCGKIKGGMALRKTHEQFIKDVYNIFKDEYTILSMYIKSDEKVKIKHNKCGKTYKATPDILMQGSGCPYCNSSKGEKDILNYLELNNIFFRTQFRIKECRDKKPLPFDFAIFDDKEKNNLKLLIEYDGEQHYILTRFQNNKERLKYIQYHDKLKTDYCNKNNIRLIRIPYWEKNNIKDILKKLLNKEVN